MMIRDRRSGAPFLPWCNFFELVGWSSRCSSETGTEVEAAVPIAAAAVVVPACFVESCCGLLLGSTGT